jgi:hypothetical protein
MELFIDDDRVDAESVGNGTLEETLHHVQSNLCAPGRMVVALRCDDQDVPADNMVSTLKKPVSSFEQIEVFTSTQGELVKETMTHASASLSQTEAECDRIADCLTEGKTAEAMEALGNCMAVWQQIHDGISKSIQILQLNAAQMEINGEPLMDVVAKPMDVLLQVKQALESQDHVLLADTLKYEFSDVMREWHAVLAAIRKHADTCDASAGTSS